MSTEEINDRFALLDKAARKSDRWWFFALLIVGMGFVGCILYWGNSELSKRDARIDGLQRELILHLSDSSTRLAEIVAANARALENNTRALEANSRVLEGRR